MGKAYAAKDSAYTIQVTPVRWPATWTQSYPVFTNFVSGTVSWAPGWPEPSEQYAGHQIVVTAPARMIKGFSFALTSDITDEYDADSDELLNHWLKVVATDANGDVVNMAIEDGGTLYPALYEKVTNYTGTKYGFTDDIWLDSSADIYDETTITFTVTIESIADSDIVGTDTTIADHAHLSITTEPSSATRGVAFSFALATVDSNGDAASIDLTASLSLNGDADGDELGDTSVSIVDGVWSGSLTITGGSGTDSESITVSASGYDSVSTGLFTVSSISLPSTFTVSGTDMPNAGEYNDFTYYNTPRTVTYSSLTNSWRMTPTFGVTKSMTLSVVGGRWEIMAHASGLYGDYSMDVWFRASDGNPDPRLCTFVYDRYSAYNGSTNVYPGTGSLAVSD